MIDQTDQITAICPVTTHGTTDIQNMYVRFFLCLFNILTQSIKPQGDDAPAGVHPSSIYRDGKLKINYSQRTPHTSKETKEDLEEHRLLAEGFHDLFEWIRINVCVLYYLESPKSATYFLLQMRHHLPDECQELCLYVDQLPLGARSPAYPFAGFVLNLCSATSGHRDPGDKILCVVAPIGKCKGGELVLYELGLVFDLRPGDIFIFPSCSITHFNLHFEGIRGSIVLHSDKYGDDWVSNCNGWTGHIVRHGVSKL